jgi:HK97 family phage prohead protease|tara:strand:+ start:4429 stop:5685 length:1257 start_codon:yes stop_codon:yes gene_type:complete
MSNRELKSIDLEFKEESEGKVSAVFSVFNNLDSDGDIVLPGAIESGFKSGSVPMVWAHKWDMPIGKGKIIEDGSKATFEGEFFMDTESGKEAYNIVKNMGDLQQWSFGYKVDDSERGTFQDGEKEIDARYLKGLTVFEVSPVLVGANQETYTMAIKSNNDLLKEISKEPEDEVNSESEDEMPEEKYSGKDLFKTAEEAEERAKELGCSGSHEHEHDGTVLYMPCKDHPAYLASIEKSMREEEEKNSAEVEEKDVEKLTFSQQVKDVLAALDDLMARANAIAMLRAKDGRKMGIKATDALRAVQEYLTEASQEIDSFIGNYSDDEIAEAEETISSEVEVEAEGSPDVETVEVEVEEEVIEEEATEAVEVEVVETEELVPVAETTETAEEEEDLVDEEFDAQWIESQQLLAETVDIEIEV